MWNTYLPDSEILVLIRLDDEEYPLVIGYHDGDHWRTSDACKLDRPVTGWLNLDEAANMIDDLEEFEVAAA